MSKFDNSFSNIVTGQACTVTMSDSSDNTISKKKTVRCAADNCNKKLGLMGIACKCGKVLCVSHIQCENHVCTYNHRSNGADQLKKQLVIEGLVEKVIKI